VTVVQHAYLHIAGRKGVKGGPLRWISRVCKCGIPLLEAFGLGHRQKSTARIVKGRMTSGDEQITMTARQDSRTDGRKARVERVTERPKGRGSTVAR
jgi:hypothetical protein